MANDTTPKQKTRADLMREFSNMMTRLYIMAEGLRDQAYDPQEKAVFNKTRGALFNLRDDANALAWKWEAQEEGGHE